MILSCRGGNGICAVKKRGRPRRNEEPARTRGCATFTTKPAWSRPTACHWYGSRTPSATARTERVCGPDLVRKITAVSQLRGFPPVFFARCGGGGGTLHTTFIAFHPTAAQGRRASH